MKKRVSLLVLVILAGLLTISDNGFSQDTLSPQVPFNILYAGGVTHTFFRVEHPQWDAVEFQTSASGGVTLMISYLDGQQIHYLDQEPMVQVRKRFDTSSRARDYRFAPMKCHLNIDKDGKVEAVFVAETDVGRIDAKFLSFDSLKELNQVVDPLNHAMEVIAILHMERSVSGDERSGVLLNGKTLPVKRDNVSFVQGANFGIIFRTDQREERMVEFRPGWRGWLGARWVYDLSGNRVSYSIEKDMDQEGFYEVKRLGNSMVQKAWIRPEPRGRGVKRVSTFSLVHDNKEFVVEFDPPLFFPALLETGRVIQKDFGFRAKIANSGWVVKGKIRMDSEEKAGRIHTRMDFIATTPEFLGKRPIHYEVIESKERYEVVATEGS